MRIRIQRIFMDWNSLTFMAALLFSLASVSQDTAAEQNAITVDGQHDRYEILLMGNSHSSYNDLPGKLQKLIEHGIPGASVHTERGPRWGFLADLLDDDASINAFNSRAWTHVVLQAQKYSTSGMYSYPTRAAEEWIRRTKALNALPVMFPEWPRLGNTEEGPRVHQLHLDIASREPACVAPIGLAWEASLQQHPDIILHASDGNHSNHNGALLTAYVLYEVITKEPASELTDQDNLGVAVWIQRKLRDIASEAAQEHPANCPGQEIIPTITPGHSGAFFDAQRDGEGQLIEMLDAYTAIIYTFTHRPDGSGPMWFIGAGTVEDNAVVFDQLVRPIGTSFGEDFDASEIFNTPVGQQSIEFEDCEATGMSASVAFTGNVDTDIEPLSINVGRLTNVLGCGAVTPHDNAGLSGSYYLPERNGEGIVVQWLPDGRVLVYFFTYDLNNNQQWVLGIGHSDGTSVTMDAIYPSGNTVWGSDFNPDDVVLSPWGTFELIWTECGSVQFSYNSIVSGYGSASREYTRLTSLWEAVCPSFN